MYLPTPLWPVVSAEKSADNMTIPLYAIYCFSLAALNILSLYVVFVILINIDISIFLLNLWDALHFFDLIDLFFFPMLGKFLTILSSNTFLDPLSFSSSSRSTLIQTSV